MGIEPMAIKLVIVAIVVATDHRFIVPGMPVCAEGGQTLGFYITSPLIYSTLTTVVITTVISHSSKY